MPAGGFRSSISWIISDRPLKLGRTENEATPTRSGRPRDTAPLPPPSKLSSGCFNGIACLDYEYSYTVNGSTGAGEMGLMARVLGEALDQAANVDERAGLIEGATLEQLV